MEEEEGKFWSLSARGNHPPPYPPPLPANERGLTRRQPPPAALPHLADGDDDAHTRCALRVQDRPYVLSFKNLMSEQVQPTSRAPTGVVMMELKHSNSGYVWIEPGASSSRFVRRDLLAAGRGSSLFCHGPGTSRGVAATFLRRGAGV